MPQVRCQLQLAVVLFTWHKRSPGSSPGRGRVSAGKATSMYVLWHRAEKSHLDVACLGVFWLEKHRSHTGGHCQKRHALLLRIVAIKTVNAAGPGSCCCCCGSDSVGCPSLAHIAVIDFYLCNGSPLISASIRVALTVESVRFPCAGERFGRRAG